VQAWFEILFRSEPTIRRKRDERNGNAGTCSGLEVAKVKNNCHPYEWHID